ncbi:hypothetical protein BS78_K138400 [Paspalum vaginatum]|uniref:Uncharacterized protein n=1 Tax=Paspalum vaginatum TaxID=158149 RepID=A0A9W8CF67_9POAL|nr:hypothetical protein BS78_K138400 [Paspalum vaginatum]
MSSQHQADQAEPLLPRHPQPHVVPPRARPGSNGDGRHRHQLELGLGDAAPDGRPGSGGGGVGPRCLSSWLTAAGFSFLTFNSGMAIYRSQGDGGAVSFVVFSYADLLTLFVCLRAFEAAEPGSVSRDRLKVVVWLLTTALTLAFSYKVAAVMPVAVAVAVWVMAFATVVGGFYAFFFCHDEKQ